MARFGMAASGPDIFDQNQRAATTDHDAIGSRAGGGEVGEMLLRAQAGDLDDGGQRLPKRRRRLEAHLLLQVIGAEAGQLDAQQIGEKRTDRKSTRLNSRHKSATRMSSSAYTNTQNNSIYTQY